MKTAVISANASNKDAQSETSLKRGNQDRSVFDSIEETENKKILKKETIFWKSRGRWNVTPQEISKYPDVKDESQDRNLETQVIWKLDLKKCIDSSPLLVIIEGKARIFSPEYDLMPDSCRRGVCSRLLPRRAGRQCRPEERPCVLADEAARQGGGQSCVRPW